MVLHRARWLFIKRSASSKLAFMPISCALADAGFGFLAMLIEGALPLDIYDVFIRVISTEIIY